MKRVRRVVKRPAPKILIGSGLVIVGLLWNILFTPAYGAQLGTRSLTISDPKGGATNVYRVALTTTTPGMLGSIRLDFCSNNAINEDVCVAPVGLDLTNVTLTDQQGATGFNIDSQSDANHIYLSRAPQAHVPTEMLFRLEGAVNPSSAGSYFMRILTYATSDASGPSSDYGGVAYAITSGVSISATVPPYLLFCTAITISNLNCANAVGADLDLGELSMTRANTASSQMLAATNGLYGYTITMGGTTLASGNNEITALAANDVSRPGTRQFGLNLVPNVSPDVGASVQGPGLGQPTPNYAQSNFYRFVTGEVVASSPTADDVRVYTVGYVVNVPVGQAPGEYATTITYVCLANF